MLGKESKTGNPIGNSKIKKADSKQKLLQNDPPTRESFFRDLKKATKSLRQ